MLVPETGCIIGVGHKIGFLLPLGNSSICFSSNIVYQSPPDNLWYAQI